jgi:hypothetical protein
VQNSARYIRWNAALVERFFTPRESGDPVYLAVDDDELASIGEQQGVEGGAAADLSRAVREWLAGGHGLHDVVRLVPGWRQHYNAPPYIALLALFVLAASRMEADEKQGVYSNDYYARLNPLLGRSIDDDMPPGFDAMGTVWRDLLTWLDTDQRGARGGSTMRTHAHFVNIGWPLSQCVLRATDRARLPYFFRFAGFEPREQVSGARLLSMFRAWARPNCGLSVAGLRAVQSTARAMQDQLAELLAIELASWDGELRDDRGRLRGEIVLFAERRAGGRSIDLALYARRPEGFPDGLFHDQHGSALELGEASDGWYRRLAVPVTAARLDGQLRLTQEQFSLAFLPELVIPMRETFVPDSGWLEARQVVPFETHMVLVHLSRRHEVEAHCRRYAAPGWRSREVTGLPAGWTIVDGLRIDRKPDHVSPHLVRLAPRLLASLHLSGGLKLVRSTYLGGGEPDVQVTVAEADDGIFALDGVEERFSAGALELPLADRRLLPGEHRLTAGGQNRSFVTVDGFDLVQPDQAGSMALVLQRHGHYVPSAAEAGPVTAAPQRGTVYIAGAHIRADPEDLPLVLPRPLVLHRHHRCWELLGPVVGDYVDGGAVPRTQPGWFRSIPGSPKTQVFEVYPRFEPALVFYTGDGQPTLKLLADELAPARWLEGVSDDEARGWAHAVGRIERSGSAPANAEAAVVWQGYVAMAETVLG